MRKEPPICLIILQPAGHTIPEGDLRKSYADNPDGWGLMARNPETKEVFVARGFGKDGANALVAAYNEYAKPGYEVAVHTRIGTGGAKDIRNTHPFEVTAGVWMMHNGIIKIDTKSAPEYCDTYHYAKHIGAKYPHPSLAIRNKADVEAIEDEIGFSKLVFMDAEGFVIVNEDLGEWNDGLWYSNDGLWSDAVYFGHVRTSRSMVGDRDAFGALDDDAERAYWEGLQHDPVWSPLAPRADRIKSRRAEQKNAERVVDDILWARELTIDDLALEVYDEPEKMAEVIFALLHDTTPGMDRLPKRMRRHFTDAIRDARWGISPESRKRIAQAAKQLQAPAIPAGDRTNDQVIKAIAASFGENTKGGENSENTCATVS